MDTVFLIQKCQQALRHLLIEDIPGADPWIVLREVDKFLAQPITKGEG